MNPPLKSSTAPNPEKGATLVLVAILLVVLLGFVALVVDLGYLFVVRNELQNVADASSLAATRLLGHMYQLMPPEQQGIFVCDEDNGCVGEIRARAQEVAGSNQAGSVSIILVPTEIRIGQWHADTDTFEETASQPDAVDVIARRDGSSNEPVSTFFARVLGIDEAPVSAMATAALTGLGEVDIGDLTLPVTLSNWFFLPGNICNEHIRFNPANDPTSCGGWTTFFDTGSEPNLEDLLNEVTKVPALTVGVDALTMNGGNLKAAFPELLMLFQRHGCATTAGDTPADRKYLTAGDDTCIDWVQVQDPESGGVEWMEEDNLTYYPDPNPPHIAPDLSAKRYYHMWETVIPVYDRDNCSNPNQSEKVVGFAPVIITDVNRNTQQIDGIVICDRFSPNDSRGGGGEFGIKGSIPGLVR